MMNVRCTNKHSSTYTVCFAKAKKMYHAIGFWTVAYNFIKTIQFELAKGNYTRARFETQCQYLLMDNGLVNIICDNPLRICLCLSGLNKNDLARQSAQDCEMY